MLEPHRRGFFSRGCQKQGFDKQGLCRRDTRQFRHSRQEQSLAFVDRISTCHFCQNLLFSTGDKNPAAKKTLVFSQFLFIIIIGGGCISIISILPLANFPGSLVKCSKVM